MDLTPNWQMAATEHASDAIVVADLAGTIRYISPEFQRTADPGPDCVIGQNLRILAGDEQPPATIESLLAAIKHGEAWTGDLVIGRANGTLFHAEATVAPVRDAAGAAVGGVAVMRDNSRQRALETQLHEYHRDRTALAAALASMRSGETAEATSQAIALALLGLPGFGGVGLFGFEPSGDLITLAALDCDGRPIALPGDPPAERSAYLRERASRGPWIEDWRPGLDHPYYAVGVAQDGRVLAYVPIRSDGETLGLLVASAADDEGLALAECLPTLVESAAFAGAMLGPQLRSHNSRSVRAVRIGAIIADRAFLPVFQPIVELEGRTVVGYEALTRFADGSRPDKVFAEAARCGLGLDLEAATLAAVLEASEPLPSSAWLNLNVSAELVLAGEPLATILRAWGGQIVLELTEHVAVTDYPALRAALERLGPNVRLAVDDAGAGFASLLHILELRPDYVKLDRAIIHGIHRDPARQALVAGLVHFAGKTNAVLIAEGVETEAEARHLRQLGVPLAQGYWLGRPVLAARLAVPMASVVTPALTAPRSRPRPAAARRAHDDIGHAVNIGSTLAAALREVGILAPADLRALGSVAVWERLRGLRPGIATATTLLHLEGATRGMRTSQLPPAETARLRLFARLGRQAAAAHPTPTSTVPAR